MSAGQIINFKITSMDGLGQGVSKESDKITFISKTYIGDTGEAVVTAQKKGVCFARLLKLTTSSPERIAPLCPHFSECPSCHFLHIDYENELSIKRDAFLRLFRKHTLPPLEVIGANRRIEYRNRIQLHYDLDQKLLGMLDIGQKTIVPIPQCLIGLPEIRQKLTELYHQDSWMKLAPTKLRQGHVEIYSINNELKVSWNKPYAEGGFTQVFAEMNEKLKAEIVNWYQNKGQNHILDLFAGNGNLSSDLHYSQRLCVDVYQELPGKDFLSQNLYTSGALKSVGGELVKRKLKPEVMLIDPPRSGMRDLKVWLDNLRPNWVVYVSCDPNTMARDVSLLPDYSIAKAYLVDFFPSTFHFESMLILERKS